MDEQVHSSIMRGYGLINWMERCRCILDGAEDMPYIRLRHWGLCWVPTLIYNTNTSTCQTSIHDVDSLLIDVSGFS